MYGLADAEAKGGNVARVSRNNPCPVCDKPGWCRVHPSGAYAICNRVASPEPALSNGWVHRLVGRRTPEDAAPSTPASDKSAPTAGPETCDAVYRALARHLPLRHRHRIQLRERSLTAAAIQGGGYASLPLRGRSQACQELLTEGHELRGVPGFFLERDGNHRWWTLAGAPGLLIPVKDVRGHIAGLQIRHDGDTAARRYSWLSSTGRPGGTGCRASVHVAQPLGHAQDERVWITEGPLKANIASVMLDAVVIGLPGVASWRKGLEIAEELKPLKGTLVVAFDMDFRTNPHVAQYRLELICAASQAGWGVAVAEWEGAKGIDDALVAAITPTIRPGRVVTHTRKHTRRVLLPRRKVQIGGRSVD